MKKLTIIEIKKKAKELGLVPAKTAKKGEIILAIQGAEGNNQCHGKGLAESCGQAACCWRPDCMEA